MSSDCCAEALAACSRCTATILIRNSRTTIARTAPKLMYSFLPIVIAVPPSNAASIAGTTPDLPFADDSGLLVVRLEFDLHHTAAFFAGRLKLPLLDRILCGADQQRMTSQGFGALHRTVGRDYDHQPYP